MIDTIVFLLNQNMFQANKLLSKKTKLRYVPRLTLGPRRNLQGRRETMLKVELSLPKLLFGNNLEELQYKDLPKILTVLVKVLGQMGVKTTEEAIANAPVLAVHYSKNISFTDGATPYHFINKIRAANVERSLDVNQTDYRNYGHTYKWHCNAY